MAYYIGHRCGDRAAYLLLTICNSMFRPKQLSEFCKSFDDFYEHQTAEDFLVLCRKVGIYEDWFRGKVLLEVGSGLGKLCHTVLRLGAKEVIGVDIDMQAIDFAAAKADQLGLAGARFESQSINYTELSEQSFDGAFSHTVFEHLDDIAGALKEIHRLLKPGGELVFTHHAFKSRMGAHLNNFISIPWPTAFFREEVLVSFWRNRRTRFMQQHHLTTVPPLLTLGKGIEHLNKIDVSMLERIVVNSPFEVVAQEAYGHEQWLLSRFPILKRWSRLHEYVRGSVIVLLRKSAEHESHI